MGFCTLWTAVIFAIVVYRMWAQIQDGHARTTPGQAVGFLFIPFFNLYWMFVAMYGLSKDINAYIDRHRLPVRPVSEGLGLTNVIMLVLSLVPFVGLLLYVPGLIVWLCWLRSVTRASTEISTCPKPQRVQSQEDDWD
jgi:hypothetical protein